MESGLKFYMSDEGKRDHIWDLIRQVDESKADRGLQRPARPINLVTRMLPLWFLIQSPLALPA